MSVPQAATEYYLSVFDSSFNVTKATMEQGAVTIPDASMSYTIQISEADVKKLFQYDTSGSIGNINDVSADDLQYYVDVTKLPGQGALATLKTDLTTEHIQYLAEQLFNTRRGVDLFNNESDLSANIVSNLTTVWNNVTSIVTAVDKSNGSGLNGDSPNLYLTNDNTSNGNLVRQLLLQMVSNQNVRFADISGNLDNDTGRFALPFIVGDKISFILTVRSDSTQRDIVGGSGPVNPRPYQISLLVVANQ